MIILVRYLGNSGHSTETADRYSTAHGRPSIPAPRFLPIVSGSQTAPDPTFWSCGGTVYQIDPKYVAKLNCSGFRTVCIHSIEVGD